MDHALEKWRKQLILMGFAFLILSPISLMLGWQNSLIPPRYNSGFIYTMDPFVTALSYFISKLALCVGTLLLLVFNRISMRLIAKTGLLKTS